MIPPVRVAPSGPLAEPSDTNPLREMAGYVYSGVTVGTDNASRTFAIALDPKGVVPAQGNDGLGYLSVAAANMSVSPAAPSVLSAGDWVVDVDLTCCFSSGSAATNSYTAGALTVTPEVLDALGNVLASGSKQSTAPGNCNVGFDTAQAAGDQVLPNSVGVGSVRARIPVTIPAGTPATSVRLKVERTTLGGLNPTAGASSGVLELLTDASFTVRKVG